MKSTRENGKININSNLIPRVRFRELDNNKEETTKDENLDEMEIDKEFLNDMNTSSLVNLINKFYLKAWEPR
jgi:hypothetical protein